MPSENPESILKMGVEGGGVEFFREWNSDGAWRFTFKGSSMGFDLDEEWRSFDSNDRIGPGFYVTLNDAIAGFSTDGDWVHWSPIKVHPDYKELVWQLRVSTLSSLGDVRPDRRGYQDRRWARICGQRVSTERPNSDRPSSIIVRPGGTLDWILGASIAVFEHLRKVPMSTEEVAEFEATMIRVLEKRQNERRSAMRSTRSRCNLDAQE